MGKTIKKFSNVLSGILSFNGLSENQLEEIEHIMRILGHRKWNYTTGVCT
jgi:hypothetical protein